MLQFGQLARCILRWQVGRQVVRAKANHATKIAHTAVDALGEPALKALVAHAPNSKVFSEHAPVDPLAHLVTETGDHQGRLAQIPIKLSPLDKSLRLLEGPERPGDLYSAATPMRPRVFRAGSWIAAALVGGLAVLVGLSGAIKGDGDARLSGALLVILSLALLLASPLAIYLAVRRGVRMVAACVVAAVVVFGTFVAGALLIGEGAY